MPNECSLESANRVVTLYSTTNGDEGGVAVANRYRTVRRGVPRAALYLAHVGPLSQEPPAAKVAERPEKTIWSSAFDFIIEGFANCGEGLHPSIQYRLDDHVPEAEAGSYEAFSANERRIVLSLVPSAARGGGGGNRATNGLAVGSQTLLEGRALANRNIRDLVLPDRVLSQSDALPAQEIVQQSRWNWLTSCWEVVTAILAHMRREREIRAAVEALGELDDLTLKDIGIHHRSQIECAVRDGHDC